MSSLASTYYTPEQYLELERAAEHRSEYVSGQVYAMSGASRAHNLIATNLLREVSLQLRGRPCETYPGDMRVKVSGTGLYTYPDVSIACGDPRFEDDHVDTLLNPTVIFEVLSPSTEAYDRGAKFAHYRRLESISDYVLLSQDRPLVEHYLRQGDDSGTWLLTEVTGLDGFLHLTSVGCKLALSDVYERVSFTDVETDPRSLRN